MRKVLLATTALVAFGGITAANADISISGNYEWEYTQNDAGSTFGDDGHINIKAVEAADNGMTFTAMTTFGGGTAANTTQNNYVQVDGDFGTVYLGNVDGNSAASLMDGALGRNKDIETQGGLGSEALIAAQPIQLFSSMAVLTSSTCLHQWADSKLVSQLT